MTHDRAADTTWFLRDRFGLFIHWSLFALPARREWVRSREKMSDADYQKYFDHFYPDLYDPVVWAREAQQAGMKYVVITTKHHEGFCLWDSALTDYKVTNTPWGKDALTPFVEAFRAAGLKIGFYHSLIDWHHPEFPIDGLHPMCDDVEFREQEQHRDVRKYAEYLHGQTRELLTQFGKIDIAWFDYSYDHLDWGWAKGKGKDDWQSEKLLAMVRELQPQIIVNDRMGIGGDIKTPEQIQPPDWLEVKGQRVMWEACHTMNGRWEYHRDNIETWKPADMLVKTLIDCVSKGGNMLLNVGPNGRGEFEPKAVERLRAIGEWLRLHGRSIYGCTASDFVPPPDCRYTQNGNRLYLHVFSWPFRHLRLPGLAARVEYAQLLNDASEIKINPDLTSENLAIVDMTTGTLTLELPVQRPDVLVPVVELFLK